MFLVRRSFPAAILVLATACASAGGAGQRWRDSDFSALPRSGLAATPVLIFPLRDVVVDPRLDGQVAADAARRAALDSVVYATLMRRAPEVGWVAPAAVERTAREVDSLPDLDQVAWQLLYPRALMGVREPLLAQLQALVRISAGRYSLVPGRLEFLPGPRGRVRAQFMLVLVDTKVGANAWASSVAGEDETVYGATTAAVRRLITEQR